MVEIEERILAALSTNGMVNGDTERVDLIRNHVSGKSSEDVMNYLEKLPPNEVGGLIAITGFYYQFLVTIGYLIELIEGKWDFLAIELHDDIVVGKGNTIRFIQVKTSSKAVVKPGDVGELYKRKIHSSDKAKSSDKEKSPSKPQLVNNCWVDKLLSKAEHFKKNDGFKTQFELVTSFFIEPTGKDFGVYIDNKQFETVIPENDSLFKELNKPVCNSLKQPYFYLSETGEPLEELLKRFHIRTSYNLAQIEAYIDHLRIKLSEKIFKGIINDVIISKEQFNLVIGELCARCTPASDQLTLIIVKEDVEGIISGIRESVMRKITDATDIHGSKQVLEKVFNCIHTKLENSPLYESLKNGIYNYQSYFQEWISTDGNIRELVNRYIDGTTKSQTAYNLNPDIRNQKLVELLMIILIMNLIYKDLLKFAKNESLLIKELNEATLKLVAFLNLDEMDDLTSGISKLRGIIEGLDIDEQLYLVDKKLCTIFSGYSDCDFTSTKRIEINTKIGTGIKELPDEHSLSKVSLFTQIIPGNILANKFYKIIRGQDDENFLDNIAKIKETLKIGE